MSLWWQEGVLSRPGARARYTTMIVVVVLLISLPAIIAALPLSAKQQPVAKLLAEVKGSAGVSYSGLASSSGQLEIPDLKGSITDVANLLSATTQLRAWYVDPTHYRVDRITATGESDTYQEGKGVWFWSSFDHQAQFSADSNSPQVPLPSATDALPPDLARRLLAEAPVSELSAIGPRKVAGRTGIGLIWRPSDKRTTIGQVRVWVDESSGLPLAVEVRAIGGQSRAFSSSFLDISLKTPTKAQVTYDSSRDQDAISDNNEGPTDNNQPRELLPATLAGLRLRSQLKPFVATYGVGPSIVAVAELGSPDAIRTLRDQIDSNGQSTVTGSFGEGSLIKTPLLNGLLFGTRDSGYILVGSVTEEQLEAMATSLAKNPPRPNTGGNG